MTEDDPLTRVLAHIDRALLLLDQRVQVLTEIRGLLRDTLGEDQPDGWAQTGHRGNE